MSYGPQGAGVLLLVGMTVRAAIAVRGMTTEDDWLNDPNAFHDFARQVAQGLKALQPPGEPSPRYLKHSTANPQRWLLAMFDPNWEIMAGGRALLRRTLGNAAFDRAVAWREAFMAKVLGPKGDKK